MSGIAIPATLREGRYVVGDLLGQGGMAVVVVAHDEELGVDRAVKLLAPHGAQRKSLRRRLKAEARAMARLNHPNILAIHDVGVENDMDYVVMDLALGGSLQDLAERGPLNPWVAAGFMVQVLSALAAAHAQGIVHRDVKPHNVLLDENGRALLADFGIALLAGEDRRTRTGVAMGSLAYMPPEQRLDAARVDATADLYAVGSSLYALATSSNPVDLFLADESSQRWNDVPEGLRPLIRRAVRMDPEERWPDAGTFAHALVDAIREAGMDLGTVHGMATSFLPTDRTQAPTRPGTPPPHEPTQAAVDYIDERVPTVTRADLPPVVDAPPMAHEPRGTLAPREPDPDGRWVFLPVLLLLLGAVGLLLAVNPVSPSPTPAPTTIAPEPAPLEPAPEIAAEPVAPPPAEPVTPALPTPPPPPEPVVVRPEPVRPAPRPVATASSAPTGRWVGALNGIAVTVDLEGPASGITGSFTSMFGSKRSQSSLSGRYDAAGRTLELEDAPGTPDPATYSLVLAEDGKRLEGQVRTARGMRRLVLERANP